MSKKLHTIQIYLDVKTDIAIEEASMKLGTPINDVALNACKKLLEADTLPNIKKIDLRKLLRNGRKYPININTDDDTFSRMKKLAGLLDLAVGNLAFLACWLYVQEGV